MHADTNGPRLQMDQLKYSIYHLLINKQHMNELLLFRGVEISTLTSYVYITGVVLPFEPITISFENVQYYVDAPKVFARSTDLTFWSFRVLDMIYIDQISSIHLPGIEKERFSREKYTASSRYYRCIQAWSSYSFDGS